MKWGPLQLHAGSRVWHQCNTPQTKTDDAREAFGHVIFSLPELCAQPDVARALCALCHDRAEYDNAIALRSLLLLLAQERARRQNDAD